MVGALGHFKWAGEPTTEKSVNLLQRDCYEHCGVKGEVEGLY